MHFDEGLSARYKAGDSTKLVAKGSRGKSASEKLSEEGLVKFSARVAIQVVRCSNYQNKRRHFFSQKLKASQSSNISNLHFNFAKKKDLL